MARHVITTTVTYFYESEDNEFASTKEAEAFGWNFDEMNYDSVYSIDVEEMENEHDEDDEELDN
jgi:hypothetical protein